MNDQFVRRTGNVIGILIVGAVAAAIVALSIGIVIRVLSWALWGGC